MNGMSLSSSADCPIAVMSFNRPSYLREVLATLAAQIPTVDPSRVVLFQDGYRSRSGSDITDPNLIEQSVKIFSDIFPGSTIVESEENIGVALNFQRAEAFLFEKKESAIGLFFEDDLILSPHYLEVMQSLIKVALQDKRIAYVAAYGDHLASLEQQMQTPTRIVQMRHKWGFALSRRQWLLQKPILEPYLEIISRTDYRSRDHQAVQEYYRKLGYGSPGTSQDSMKDVASAVLGTTKIMTYACFGKNIGEHGLHSFPELYTRAGFDKTQIYPEPVTFFADPDAATVDRWIEHGRDAARQALVPKT